jgi:hypothetical protein
MRRFASHPERWRIRLRTVSSFAAHLRYLPSIRVWVLPFSQ